MSVRFINKNTNKEINVKIVSKNTSTISLDTPIENTSMVLSNSNKTLNFNLLPSDPNYIGVQSTNKIFGSNSFETKVLGDSLYTNSNIITGGSTPFTIEFYALIKTTIPEASTYVSLVAFDEDNFANNGQGLYIHKNTLQLVFYRYTPQPFNTIGKSKIFFNEINKITMSYDGSAFRFFINDVLDFIIGTINPIIKRDYISFMRSYSPMSNGQHTGIIDNINTFDGEARIVRDYDEHADKLVVDLSFDGENGSTKIVDNGTLKYNWIVNGSAKISIDQKFDGFSSLYLGSTGYVSSTCMLSLQRNFTISFDYIRKNVSAAAIIDYRASVGTYNGFLLTHPSVNNNKMNLYFNGNGTSWQVNLMTNSDIIVDKKYRIYIVCLNNTVSIYVDGVLDVTQSYNEDVILSVVDQRLLTIGRNVSGGGGSLLAYIKNFKIYKDVAIKPESPVGKIQLDFDNNVIDKYNNSTWTNNGVTFDQVNSVKGHAAYFNYNSSKLTCNNSILDLTNSKGRVTFDTKIINKNTGIGWDTLITSGNTGSVDRAAFAFSTINNTIRHRVSNNLYNDAFFNYVTNTYYNVNIIKDTNISLVVINDCIISSINSNLLNFNSSNQCTIGGALYNTSEGFNGYIDNFKSIKDYQGDIVVDKPAVHLPLETNAVNIGYSNLTINSVGSPTYTTVDGKKCIKFESEKYLTINSNNIFNLGTNSDFYMEFDFYPLSLANNPVLFDSFSSTTNTYQIQATSTGLLIWIRSGTNLTTDLTPTPNTWNNLKLFRKNQQISMVLNDTVRNLTNSPLLNDATVALGAQVAWRNSSYDFNGYMSNFKMFVGTSEIPETYNDKKVLDLDFKPTRKSYLFKDNNNKCVIHPVNITQRDYQDSQYCCTFNGINQYLQLGKNDLLNFGLDDFVIEIKFAAKKLSRYSTLLNNGDIGQNRSFVVINNTNKVSVGISVNGTWFFNDTTNTIHDGALNYLLIVRHINTLSITLNDIETVHQLTSFNFNLNGNNNTTIGFVGNNANENFDGTIYSIKVLRNTTDLTLLDTEEESGGGEDDYTPITLSLNTPSTVENPVEGSYTNIYGVIRYADLLPTVTVMFNGNEVNQEDITLTSRGTINAIEQDYDLQIRILNDALDGTYPITVTVGDTFDVANGSTSLTVIRDYPLISQGLDSFNTSWYQLSTTNKVGTRNYQEEQMMYFNGLSSLTANGYSWKFGLDQFTIELDFALTKSPSTNNYHILSCGKTESWYAIEITSNREIRFLNRGTVKVSTTTNVISINTKYRLAITRDSKYNLRIFLNGTKVAEAVDNSNYTFDEDTSDLNHNVFLGRVGTLHTDTVAEKHFKGYMKNFYFNKGVCLYTENYTPTVLDKGITTKSLLTFTSDDVGFTTKVDSFNPNITWNNSGCTVANNQLVLGSVSNRLVSTENDLFNFTNQNWTIDIIGTTSQITTEAVLFDNRLSGSSFNGILIRQSPSDPTSLTISLGISTATTGYSYIINTGVNSLVANTEFNLKVVRSLGQLIVFLNGVRKNRTTIYTNSFETSKTVCIGNNKDFNKGFNGKIRQVRIINGIATNVHAYPIIEGDILT